MKKPDMKMTVEAPLCAAAEVAGLCAAGADEFFCGIEPRDWNLRFGGVPVNRRTGDANFSSVGELREAVAEAHRRGRAVNVAFNAFYWNAVHLDSAVRLMEKVLALGADGFIVADLGLMLSLPRTLAAGAKITVGTDAVVLNAGTAEFFRKLGAGRVVLPRALTPRQMQAVVRSVPGLEYTAFVMNNRCFFVDGLCSFCKAGSIFPTAEGGGPVRIVSGPYLGPRGMRGCKTEYLRYAPGKPGAKVGKFLFWGDALPRHACGACALYELRNAGVTGLKVLDRGLCLEQRTQAVRFIRTCLEALAAQNLQRARFRRFCRREFAAVYGERCAPRDCYYPDIGENPVSATADI